MLPASKSSSSWAMEDGDTGLKSHFLIFCIYINAFVEQDESKMILLKQAGELHANNHGKIVEATKTVKGHSCCHV